MTMKNLHIPVSIIVLLICGGCIPLSPYSSPEFGTRGQIDDETLEFIQVGSTTKEEVLLGLGEPEKAWKNQKRFLYLWNLVVGISLVPLGILPRTDLLLIEFDETDVVKRYEIRKWVRPAFPYLRVPEEWL